MRSLRSLRTATALVALMAIAAGCASSGASSPRPPRSSADRIAEAELEPFAQFTAYEAIQRLRPSWLQTRTAGPPILHLDGIAQSGGLDVLRSLSSAEVQEMQYMSAPDATTRFGTGYVTGLILVVTKR